MIDIQSLLQNPMVLEAIAFGIIMLVKKWIIRIGIALVVIAGVVLYLFPSLHLP